MQMDDEVRASFDSREFDLGVSRVLGVLVPLETAYTQAQLIALLQYVSGVLMADANILLREQHVTKPFQAIWHGYKEGNAMSARRKAAKEHLQ